MKIDIDLIEQMVKAGATPEVLLTYLRKQDAKWAPRRAKDRVRKSAENRGTKRKPTENQRNEAILAETPRARMFREAKSTLLTLGIDKTRAGGLIVEWLKLTHDDDQLITAAILKAQELAVADAPAWILATLRGKTNGQRGSRPLQDDAKSVSKTLGTMAQAAERGQLAFEPRPSLLPESGADDLRVLPKG